MTDKEIRILDILRGSIDALSAEEIATRIYGEEAPSDLVRNKLYKLEAQGYVEIFYMKKSYKFLITENGEQIEQIRPNEQIMFEFLDDSNSKGSKEESNLVFVDNNNNTELQNNDDENSVGGKLNIKKDDDKEINSKYIFEDIKNINVTMGANIEDINNTVMDKSIDENNMNTIIDSNSVDKININTTMDNNDLDSSKMDSSVYDSNDSLDEKAELEEIFNKENKLKEQFNKAWSEILKEEKDYYSLMDGRSFSLLKSALNNINCISTFRTTIAFIRRLDSIFNLSNEEIIAIEEDSRALKVNDSSFDVEHIGELSIVAEIKCNISTTASNRFGAGLTAAIKKDIDSLINGKPRSRIKDVTSCYKFMVLYKNEDSDEVIDEAVSHLIRNLPNDLSKYLLVYREGMIMSKDYVYIYIM